MPLERCRADHAARHDAHLRKRRLSLVAPRRDGSGGGDGAVRRLRNVVLTFGTWPACHALHDFARPCGLGVRRG
eukprot:2137918-Prymnesium_polylepis.1